MSLSKVANKTGVPSDEDLQKLINEFLTEAEGINKKAEVILNALDKKGHNVTQSRKALNESKETVKEAWTWSWKGAAIGGACGLAAGAATGALCGGPIGALIGGIVGLISCGAIGGAFAENFSRLVDRIKKVEICIGSANVKAHLS